MCHIVANISKQATAKGCGACIPVEEEDCVSKPPERRSEHAEHDGWHDEPVFVHGEVVVNTMEEKVGRDSYPVVGKVTVVLSVLSHCLARITTYSSKWNSPLCSTYSIMVQKASPKSQDPVRATMFNCWAPWNVHQETRGSQRVGTTHHAVLLRGSKKLPKSGADGPPL